MKLNKTQQKIADILYQKKASNLKAGYTTYQNKELGFILTMQNLNMINQAGKLAERYPQHYEFNYKQWRLATIRSK